MRSKRLFSAPELPSSVGRLLAGRVTDLELVHRGRNSRVTLASLGDGRQAVVKQYRRDPGDPRDRVGVEALALRFLCRNGFEDVPEVLAVDREAGIAIFRYVEGATFPPERAGVTEIDLAVGFVARLAGLRGAQGASEIPDASEATFSEAQVRAVVRRRLDRLRGAGVNDPALAAFLEDEFVPALARAEQGPPDPRELDPVRRTLSPSDFGFHNAIRDSSGSLTFVDFEYFGWDDPAKLVCDFVLHPGMELDSGLRRRFATGVVEALGDDTLQARIEAVYPLHAAKWALIVLNEFLPSELDRRRFAGEGAPAAELLERQLEKARRLVEQVDNHHAELRDRT
jgi:hypothetical protein